MVYSINKLSQDIKGIKIQGATNIATEVFKKISQVINKKNYSEAADIFFNYSSLKSKLLRIRPTEPLLENGFYFIEKNWPQTLEVKILKKELAELSKRYLTLIESNQQQIVRYGKSIIKNKEKIFTHCHSSVIEKILVKAKKSKKKFFVYLTETRPLFQGRITAKNLIKNRIRTIMVADSAAGFLISQYSGQDLMIDKVIIGADALFWDGSVINKVGSYGISLAARDERVPIFIATTLLKLDHDNKIKIERREKSELWSRSPQKLKIINFAFDIVPAEFITGIICEFGIIKPNQVKNLVEKNYPWLIKK